MNAIELLTRQHREVSELFTQIEKAPIAERATLVADLAKKLSTHMQIEEEVFYPAVYEIDSQEVHNAMEEHEDAKVVLESLVHNRASESVFFSKLVNLKEKIAHHVKEEEGKLFPKARKEIAAGELEELCVEMQDLLEEIEMQIPQEKSA